jgi:DNA-binding SARP family transcriptional activator
MMIELRAVGAAEIETDSTILTPSQTVVFAVALYLILERDKLVSRDRLAAIIWPSADPRLRAHRLRQTILQLKKLGLRVNATRHQLKVEASQLRSDVELAVAGDVEFPRMSCFEFLPGYDPAISEPFREWVDAKRSQIHRKLTSRLVREIESARHRGDWGRVEEAAERCLSLDRYNESAVLAQAEAVAMRGAKRKAVSMLDDFLTELGGSQSELKLPATILRRRVVDRIPERTACRQSDARFVGREAEMELLTHRFETVRSGRGRAIQLVGQPGVGKTRLCQEFARFAELQGAYVEQARCRRTYVERPISLFAELVPRLRELPGALGCDPNTLLTLRRLTEFDKSLNGISTSDQSQPLFENVKDAVFDLFDSVLEESALVIMVDDAQWLDTASQKLLVTMVEWAEEKRLLVILNARDSTDLLTASFETVRLGPLSAQECKSLLESMPIPKDIASRDSFLAWSLNIAEGNPFFLQELLHHWLETGQTLRRRLL